jgi:Putative MetA-pathway of phenol degradation
VRRLFRRGLAAWLTGVVALSTGGQDAIAQELEPGAYQNAPVGLNALYAGYGRSRGNVLFDAALPVEDVQATVDVVALAYLRTLSVAGRSGKLDVQVPLSWARFEGTVAGEFRTRSPKGFADPRVRLAVNVLGASAFDQQGFRQYRQQTIVGASLQVVLPLGQYDRTRFINLGAHRWAFRPEMALSHATGRWIFEIAAGTWLFTDNDDYAGGARLSQRPLYFAKGNAIYAFRRGLWASVSYGHAEGGQTALNDLIREDLQRNDRIAATLSLPVARASAVKLVLTTGLTTRLGPDFDSIGAGYQYSWSAK